MTNFNKQLLQNTNPEIETRNLSDIEDLTGNIYRSLVVAGKRSNQIASDMKEELHAKLAEFASTTDNLEEIFENREQIEISRFYEKLPHPTILAMNELQEDKIHFRFREEENAEGEEENKEEKKK